MGLVLPVLRLIVREHKRQRFDGPVLTLGRQGIYGTFDQVQKLLASEGIEPRTVDKSQVYTNLPSWRTGDYSHFTSDKAVFEALGGFEVVSLDVSDYEGADYKVDLNAEVPAELKGKFGLILDLGTLEHVFDVRQALRNINLMLKPGGRVIHSSPGTNWLGHGFYQFSPTLFYDYYGTNKFTSFQCLVGEMPTWDPRYQQGWRFYEWDIRRPSTQLVSSRMLVVYFCAEKTAASTLDEIPQQGGFLGAGTDSRMKESVRSSRSLVRRIAAALPPRAKALARRILGKDLSMKPWGLKYIGKF